MSVLRSGCHWTAMKNQGSFWVVVCFNRLDDPIFRAARHDPHSGSGFGDRLVVARVHGQAKESAMLRSFFPVHQRARAGSRGAMSAVWATATFLPAEWFTGSGSRSCTSEPPR